MAVYSRNMSPKQLTDSFVTLLIIYVVFIDGNIPLCKNVKLVTFWRPIINPFIICYKNLICSFDFPKLLSILMYRVMIVLPHTITVYTMHLRGWTPDTYRWYNDLSHLLHSNWILAQAKRSTTCHQGFLFNIQRAFRFCPWPGSNDRKQVLTCES